MILLLNIIFWVILIISFIIIINSINLKNLADKGKFSIATGVIILLLPFNFYIYNLEEVKLIERHSIENCDKSNKCFKRIIFETCYESENGYDCRIVKGSERVIGTELMK